MKNEDKFDGNFIDKSLLQFCFMRIMQDTLDDVAQLWNAHRIRPSRHQIALSGRPNTMYHLPEVYGFNHQACPVKPEHEQECESICTPKNTVRCDKDIFELCCIIMTEYNVSSPRDAEEATQLYRFLREIILDDLQE
ncbi:hypothetical protein KP79_PYT02859 [Mizuhopecten yessoensis]|uniref:Uncharacterized protein n=2 Tax=Mizuhopecten yessoensis TaxID=6573 RepID=A0A210PJX6_MIZYE|nr:hypothetical protein KP79_PYT02859 [Mizuhopecten yessoensis]